ncbi:dynamin-like protein 6 [Tanacetum coccineum]
MFPDRIKQHPLDKHFDLQNVKRIMLEADGYQPYLISLEKGLRSLIKGELEMAKEALRLCVDEIPFQYGEKGGGVITMHAVFHPVLIKNKSGSFPLRGRPIDYEFRAPRQPREHSTETTSKHLAKIAGKFDKNITRRGLVRKTSTNKTYSYNPKPKATLKLQSSYAEIKLPPLDGDDENEEDENQSGGIRRLNTKERANEKNLEISITDKETKKTKKKRYDYGPSS